jgi:hypothetical protein
MSGLHDTGGETWSRTKMDCSDAPTRARVSPQQRFQAFQKGKDSMQDSDNRDVSHKCNHNNNHSNDQKQ